MKNLLMLLSLQFSLSLCANFVCYFPNWARYRTGNGQFTIANINTGLCTHMMYAFAVLDPTTYKIKVFDQWADVDLKGYTNFVALKSQNPSLKTMISVGGWTDSTDGTNKYSKMAASATNINTFVSSVVAFLQLYKFDGLDLDWEYPKQAGDKANFANLMAALKNAFKPYGYLLSAAVAADPATVDAGYDLVSLSQSTDFLNLMTYDMHGSWETRVDHHAPLYKRSFDTTNNYIDYVVNYYITKGYPASKLNLGIPLYGRSWKLSSSTTTPLAPASGPGAAGPFTAEAGYLGYNEICNSVKTSGWQVFQDSTGASGPYAVSPTAPRTWVGYDDPAMAAKKARYAISKGLGGAMVWDVSTDDFLNVCGAGANPVMSAIKTALGQSPSPATTTTSSATTAVPTTTKATTTTTKAPTTTTKSSGTFTCPSDGLFPDPANCSKYYNCGNGIAYSMSCPTGLLFNPAYLYCDWSYNVVCSTGK